jgi:hypothetical protein
MKKSKSKLTLLERIVTYGFVELNFSAHVNSLALSSACEMAFVDVGSDRMTSHLPESVHTKSASAHANFYRVINPWQIHSLPGSILLILLTFHSIPTTLSSICTFWIIKKAIEDVGITL